MRLTFYPLAVAAALCLPGAAAADGFDVGKMSDDPVVANLGELDPAVVGFQPGDRVA